MLVDPDAVSYGIIKHTDPEMIPAIIKSLKWDMHPKEIGETLTQEFNLTPSLIMDIVGAARFIVKTQGEELNLKPLPEETAVTCPHNFGFYITVRTLYHKFFNSNGLPSGLGPTIREEKTTAYCTRCDQELGEVSLDLDGIAHIK